MVSIEESMKKPDHSLLMRDNITPYKICTLILIREYLETKSSDESDQNYLRYTDDERKSVMLLLMHLLEVPDMQFSDLRVLLSQKVKHEFIQRFEQKLLSICQGSFMQLFDFFDRLNEPIKKDSPQSSSDFTQLNKTSVVGLFVRSMMISFKFMPLEDITGPAFRELIDYCRELFSPDQLGDSLPLQSTQRTPVSRLERSRPSRWQAERRIITLANLLEDNEREAGNPQEVSRELESILTSYPTLYQAHFVQYLNYMRVREYSLARDHLHQYHDKLSVSEKTDPSNLTDLGNQSSRYASLNLASFYARFGHREQAMYSVKEGVKLAQESNDKICLKHALVWLQHLQDPEKLLALPGQHEVEPIPSFNLNHIDESSHSACQLARSSSLIQLFKSSDRAQNPRALFTHVAKLGQSAGLLSFHEHASQSVAAALWSHYGYENISGLVSQALIHSSISNTEKVAEAECLALCNLSYQQFHQGNYLAAQHLLNTAKELYAVPSSNSEIWCQVEQTQLFDRAYLHADTKSMSIACDYLLPFSASEAKLRQAALLRVEGHYQRAYAILNNLLSSMDNKDTNDLALNRSLLVVRVNLEMIELCCYMEDYELAFKYISATIDLASMLNLNKERALACLYAASVQLVKGNTSAALNLISDNLADLLIFASQVDGARAQLLYAKCKMSASSSSDRLGCVGDCIKMVELAKETFIKCEAYRYLLDCLLYLSLLYNLSGDISSRNQCSLQFKQMKSLHNGMKILRCTLP